MKKILLLILVSLFSLGVFPQTADPQAEGKLLMEEIAVSLQAKRFDEVIVKSSRIIELSPKSGEVYTIRGLAYFSTNEKEKAVADFTKAIELGVKPDLDLTAYRMRAVTFYQLKRFDEAIRDFSVLIAKEPADFRGFVYRGRCYLYSDRFEPAVKDFDSALKLSPDEPGVKRSRAAAHLKLGNFEKAAQDATDEIKTAPKEAELYKIRGEAYRKLGKVEQAEADEKAFAELGGKTGPVVKAPPTPQTRLDELLARSQRQFEQKEFDAAIKTYDEIIDLIGEDAEGTFAIYFSRGRCYFTKGQLEPALADYNRVIRLEPALASGYTFRGEVYLLKKQYDLAVRDLSRAIELDGKDILAYRRRAELYYVTKEYDKAVRDASEVLRLDPQYQSGWYYRGASYLEKGDYRLAIEDFNEYLRLEPEDGDVFADRARAYRKLGKIKEAEADEKRAGELKQKK